MAFLTTLNKDGIFNDGVFYNGVFYDGVFLDTSFFSNFKDKNLPYEFIIFVDLRST